MLENCSTVIRTALTQKLMFNSLRRGTQRRKSAIKSECGVTLEVLEDRSLLSAGDLFVAELPQTRLVNDDALAPGVTGLLTEPATGNPLDIGLEYLRENAASVGLTPDDLEDGDFTVTNAFVSNHNGVSHFYLDQVHNGLEVLNADISFSVTNDGRIISLSSSFIAGLDSTGTAEEPTISAVDGFKSVAEYFSLEFTTEPEIIFVDTTGTADIRLISHAGAALEDVPYELEYAPNADGEVELAWRMNIQTLDSQHWYDVAVSAVDGEILQAGDWINRASYTALDLPFENPEDGAFTTLVDVHDPIASPFGWHDTDGIPGAEFTDTRGNNVFAQEDQDANNTGGARPDGGPALDFDFAFDPNQDAPASVDAATVNLFVQNNLIHDVLYQYGFDEQSGNFQNNNYGNGGIGGDQVEADSLDGSGVNNANFATPPDGIPGRMQMFEFTFTNPTRDSDLSNFIIAHEYGHGLTNRLTGGPADSGALFGFQSGGMGEGWSDFLGLMLTQKASDLQFDAYATGNYVLGNPLDDPNGGIRRFPYSFDMSISPQTYGDYNQLVGGAPHPIGEIIAATMWDLNWLLVNGDGLNIPGQGFDPDLYNGTGGNNVTMQLFIDGLKLQPALPTFVDYRDAVLLADEVNNGGANQLAIWTAFARRGIGFSADDGGSANALRVVEAFDLPPIFLQLDTPAEVFENDAQALVTVTRPVLLGVNTDLVVTLASSDTSEITVPAQVTIDAGQTQTSFIITIHDDDILDGDQRVAISANAPGFITEQQVITVKDHETLTVEIQDDEIPETGGPAATTATVTRSNTSVESTSNIYVSQFNEITEFTSDGVLITEAETVTHGSETPIDQRLFSTTFASDIIEIDPNNGAILNSFEPPNAFGEGLAWNGESLFWNSGGGTILELDPDTGVVRDTHNVPSPTSFNSGLAHLNGYLYISNWGAISNGITVFDPDTDTVVRSLNLDVVNNGARVAFVGGIAAITSDGDDALLVSAVVNGQDVIAEIDPFTGRIESTFNRSNSGFGVAVVDGEVFVADGSDQPIVVSDRAGNTLRTIDPSRFFGHDGLAGDDAAEGFRHERETLRDLVVTESFNLALYDGTEDVFLTTRPVVGGGAFNFESTTGLSSSGPLSGGIAALGDFVFLSDESTNPSAESGIVRFDSVTGTSNRFSNGESYIDLIAGWDGNLYGLTDGGRQIDAFDPDTMFSVGTVVLPTPVLGIAVNSEGEIFTVNGSSLVQQFDAAGGLMNALDTSVNGLFDIDISGDDDIVIGSETGRVVTTNADLDSTESFFANRPGEPAFVSFTTPVIPGNEGGTLPALTVAITNSDETEIGVPVTVTIPNGAQSVTFDVAAIDDFELDGTQRVVIGAFESQYIVEQDIVDVLDVEEIFVNVVADEIAESAGENATTVEVRRSAIDGPFTFATSHEFENNEPKTINDNSTVSSSIEVPTQFGQITDVNVTIDIDHRRIGDLIVELESPSGTRVELVSNVGNNGRRFAGTVFDDESFVAVIDGVSPFSSSFRPEQPLSDLDGENPGGEWILWVTDNATRDVGILNGWQLNFDMVGLPELQVLVQSGDITEAIVPTLVTIPVNQSTVITTLDAVDDRVLDGTQSVTVVGSVPNSTVWVDGDDIVNVTDEETLLLSVNPGSVTEDGGLSAITGTVSRSNIDLSQPLVVELSSSDTTEATVRATVTIPAGLPSASFAIDIVDDTQLDGNQIVTITATNPQYSAPATAELEVVDREELLEVTLNETSVFENRGFITGRVRRIDSVALDTTLVVTLTSSDPGEAAVPMTVTIPPLAVQAAFSITLPDDDILDGDQVLTITATAPNVNSGFAELTVLDFEEITYTATPTTFTENLGDQASVLTITRPAGTIGTEVDVTLTSSDETEVSVPVTVVIPADDSSIDVPLTAVNDSEVDGSQNVIVTIQAEGFIQAEVAITVLDHEPPLLIGPAVRTGTDRPEFTWSPVEGATGYDLWVTNLSTNESQILREPNLPGNVTSYTPSVDLPLGRYRYWVRARGATEVLGAWSTGRTFMVTTRPTITSPIRVTSTSTPEIQWTAVAGPDVTYTLWLRDLTRNIDQVLLIDSIPTTTYALTNELDPGVYRVWVRATSSDGVVGSWSNGATFSQVPIPEILDLPESTFDRTQPVTWAAIPGVSHYEISYRNQTTGQGNFILDRFVTGVEGEDTVTFRPTSDLPNGEYRIFVRSVSTSGIAGDWSPAQTMRVGGAPKVTGPVGLTGGIVTFTWTPVNEAARYELWVSEVDGPRVVHVPNSTTTFFTNTTALEPGNYRIWVRAFSVREEATEWSEPVDFTVVSNVPARGFTPIDGEPEIEPLMFAKFETTLASEQHGATGTESSQPETKTERIAVETAVEVAVAEATDVDDAASVDTLMEQWPTSHWWDSAVSDAISEEDGSGELVAQLVSDSDVTADTEDRYAVAAGLAAVAIPGRRKKRRQ